MLRTINVQLHSQLRDGNLDTPTREFISKINKEHKTVLVENLLLKRRMQDITKILGSRRERRPGKQLIIESNDGRPVISTVEMWEKLDTHEKAQQEKKDKPKYKPGQPRKQLVPIDKSDEELDSD